MNKGYEPPEVYETIRALHSGEARAFVRTLTDVNDLVELSGLCKRRTVREAIRGRINRLRKGDGPYVWRPDGPDHTVRRTFTPGTLHTCSRCNQTGTAGDESEHLFGVRRKRTVLNNEVEYVVMPQSYCRTCAREWVKAHRRKDVN